MEYAGTRESTSRNHANGSTPHRLQEAIKLRSTAAVLPPLSLPKKVQFPRLCAPEYNRGNWTFFGSDRGGRTAAVLLSFIASCKRCGVEPFAWFCDVLTRIAKHPVNRLAELLPHNWKALAAGNA